MAFASLAQLKSQVWETREKLVADLKKGGFKAETPAYRPAQADSGSWYIEDIDLEASQEVQFPVEATKAAAGKKPAVARAKPSAIVADKSWPEETTAKKWLAAHPQPGLAVTLDEGRGVYCLRPIDPAATLREQEHGEEIETDAAANGKVVDLKPTPAKAKANPPEEPKPKPAEAPKPKAATKPTPPAKGKAKTPDPTKPRGKSSDPSLDELPKGFNDWVVGKASNKEGVLRTEIKTKVGFERRWMPTLTALAKARGLKATMLREGRFTRFFMKK